MLISLIAAIGKNRVIGKNDTLIWHIPPDLQHFKATTMHHHILMGRKTYETLPATLKGRTLVVISKKETLQDDGSVWFTSIREGIRFAQNRGEQELFVIGGGSIFEATINRADKLYLTQIEAEAAGDVFFPEVDFNKWKLTKQSALHQYHEIPFTFTEYERKRPRKTRFHEDE